MKKIVLSGINLSEGGPLTIYKECLGCLEKYFLKEYRIIALVHDRNLFSEYESKIEFIEFKDSKKSYLKRMYYEYFYFKKLSKKLKPYLWFSLHDMTPNVRADKRVVVQQDWIRKKFKQIFKIKNVIVAHPNVVIDDLDLEKTRQNNVKTVKKSFLYPSFPRIFKNFEVICEAVKILEEKNVTDFTVYLTVDGSENLYSKKLFQKYKDLKNIKFLGLLKRKELMKYYESSENIIFPSKLETWGLPISEAKIFGKNILLADLEYAHETLGNYKNVMFFEPDDAEKLAEKMEILINGENVKFDGNLEKNIENPFCKNWKELFDILLEDNK